MIPLVSQIYDAARGVLGDNQVAGGEVFTDTILETHYQVSYAELYRALINMQSPLIQREAYYNVPINTSVVMPSTMGISNMGTPLLVEERGGVTAWNINGVTPGSAIATVTTATANSLVSGNQAIVYGVEGISDDVNDVWAITSLSTTSLTLNGCTATGTYTAATGVISISTEAFQEVVDRPRIAVMNNAPGNTFGIYAWEFGRFRFPPCASIRQLRVTYKLSGNAPTTTTASVGIDDSLTFLAYRCAGLAARSKGMKDRAAQMTMTAVGARWETEGFAGGILGQMLDVQVRVLQNLDTNERRSPGYGGDRDYKRSDWIL